MRFLSLISLFQIQLHFPFHCFLNYPDLFTLRQRQLLKQVLHADHWERDVPMPLKDLQAYTAFHSIMFF